jgi:hypothetical protein
MSDERKERNTLKLILIVRFACATLGVKHPIYAAQFRYPWNRWSDIGSIMILALSHAFASIPNIS